jgi:hypothetical protein
MECGSLGFFWGVAHRGRVCCAVDECLIALIRTAIYLGLEIEHCEGMKMQSSKIHWKLALFYMLFSTFSYKDCNHACKSSETRTTI